MTATGPEIIVLLVEGALRLALALLRAIRCLLLSLGS
jgi:hypothetical protein